MGPAIDEILVEVGRERLRAAALSGGALIELVVEPVKMEGAVGSIHLGRVVRYMPALRAAFVEIGLARPAMLDSDQPVDEGTVVPVQIIEAAFGDKAARVSRRLALEGRHAVLLPGGKGVAVSRRIVSEKIRSRLQALGATAKPPGYGVIMRAASAAVMAPDLAADIARLQARWTAIDAVLKQGTPPALAYDNGDGLLRLLRLFAGAGWPRFVFDNATVARRVMKIAAAEFGDAPPVEIEPRPGTLFDRSGIAEILASAEQKTIALPSGGQMTIEITAALTAVDVDTAAASSRDDAVLQTNLEAAAELGRQLRLRDIGGLIVADFGRMAARAARDRVEATLGRAVSYDRVAVQLVGWTRAGMFEMVRPRIRAAGGVD
jgi:ribonuclease G